MSLFPYRLHFPQFPEAGEACFPRESEGFGLSSLVGCTPETAIIKEDSTFSRRFPPPPVRKLRKVQMVASEMQVGNGKDVLKRRSGRTGATVFPAGRGTFSLRDSSEILDRTPQLP